MGLLAFRGRRRQAELSVWWRRRFLEDLRAASQQRRGGSIARQPLVSANYQIAVRQEPFHDAAENLVLQRYCKIGEGDIAAEDEIEKKICASNRKS